MKLPTLPADVPASVKRRLRRDDGLSLRPYYTGRALLAAFPKIILVIPLVGVPLFCYFRDVNLFSMRVARFTIASVVATCAISYFSFMAYLFLRDKYDFTSIRLREKLDGIIHLFSRRY